MCWLCMMRHLASYARSGSQDHGTMDWCLLAGMLAGAAFVGVHMALTHGVTLGMVASYIPATEIKGIGRITGTCWSFTDFVFGERLSRAACCLPPSPVLASNWTLHCSVSLRGTSSARLSLRPGRLHACPRVKGLFVCSLA